MCVTCSLWQRKSSSPKTPTPPKRQRKHTTPFEFKENTPRTSKAVDGATPGPSSVDVAFDKGSFLGVRADGGMLKIAFSWKSIDFVLVAVFAMPAYYSMPRLPNNSRCISFELPP